MARRLSGAHAGFTFSWISRGRYSSARRLPEMNMNDAI
ncbi:hypothetical protein BURPS668_A2458 [Burkholderia pseudomallei 668]|nr:hypothetical protein BURPS668_A2458 [Burkholderia pseudomallei 668]